MKEEVRWEEGVQGRGGSILIPENTKFNLGIGSEIKRIVSHIINLRFPILGNQPSPNAGWVGDLLNGLGKIGLVA